MSEQPTEVFGLYTGNQKNVTAWTRDPTVIGQWVLDSPENAAVRLKLPEYWKAVAKEQAFDGSLNFFTVLEQALDMAKANEDELVLHRLANLNEYDFEAYDGLFTTMSDDFYNYLQRAEFESRKVSQEGQS